MLKTRTRISKQRDGAAATDAAAREYAMEMASTGFEKSQDIIASEATDTGQLLRSGIPPRELDDGSVIWGYAADYARPVNDGSIPHWPPIRPLLGWARRVLGDESAAYAVQKQIAAEGTRGVHFIERSMQTMQAWAESRDLGDYLTERL